MSQVVKHYILFFCVLFQTAILFNISTRAQNKNTAPTNWPEPVFEHLTIADGLPENSVRCMLQDHLGYMWFGTQNGLVRYDGYNMKVYQTDPNDSLSISDRQIYSIYEDKSKTLWVGTSGGLNKFDRINETFKKYTNNPDDSTSINSNKIVNIYEDNSGNIWVSTYKGLSLFDRQTENFRHIPYKGLEYSPALYKYILSLIAKKKRIASILRVENNADLTKSFKINKETVVLTMIIDEAGSDDGWLESTNGEIIAGRKNKNIVYTGGNSRNQIEIEVDTLPIGNYKLRYVSDASWSYNHFQGDYPEFWGIQVIELGKEQMKIGGIQDYEKPVYMQSPYFSKPVQLLSLLRIKI